MDKKALKKDEEGTRRGNFRQIALGPLRFALYCDSKRMWPTFGANALHFIIPIYPRLESDVSVSYGVRVAGAPIWV